MVLSEVAERLMMMSGSDASTCRAECGQAASSRFNEVVTIIVPAGHRRRPGEPGRGTFELRSGHLFLTPFERSAIDPDAMENDCDLPRDGYLGLFHSDTLGEFHSPSPDGGPLLRAVQQDSCGLEEVGSQQPIAPP